MIVVYSPDCWDPASFDELWQWWISKRWIWSFRGIRRGSYARERWTNKRNGACERNQNTLRGEWIFQVPRTKIFVRGMKIKLQEYEEGLMFRRDEQTRGMEFIKRTRLYCMAGPSKYKGGTSVVCHCEWFSWYGWSSLYWHHNEVSTPTPPTRAAEQFQSFQSLSGQISLEGRFLASQREDSFWRLLDCSRKLINTETFQVGYYKRQEHEHVFHPLFIYCFPEMFGCEPSGN